MDALFQIITMIIPKAGVATSGVPITLSLVLFAFVILRNPNQTVRSIQRRKWIGILYGLLFFFGITTFLLGVLDQFQAFQLAQIVTVISSPLAGVIALRIRPEKSFRILCIALILVNIYALIQFFAGIEQVAIAGITYTFGQDITEKPIGYGMSQTASALKMPSTYQNGNYLGVFDALGISLILLWHPDEDLLKIAKYCAVVSGVIGIILCGSRSTIIPFALVAVLLIIQQLKVTKARTRSLYLAGTFLTLTGGILYLGVFQRSILQQFFSRNIAQTLADPTGAGRTSQWSTMMKTIGKLHGSQLLRLFCFGQGSGYGLGGEGLPTFFTTFGIFATTAFYGMLIASMIYLWRVKMTRTVAMGVFCTIFAFCVDSSFYYPPNIMIVFIIIGSAFSASEQLPTKEHITPIERRTYAQLSFK